MSNPEYREIQLLEALMAYFDDGGQPRQVFPIMTQAWEEAIRDLLRDGLAQIKKGAP